MLFINLGTGIKTLSPPFPSPGLRVIPVLQLDIHRRSSYDRTRIYSRITDKSLPLFCLFNKISKIHTRDTKRQNTGLCLISNTHLSSS